MAQEKCFYFRRDQAEKQCVFTLTKSFSFKETCPSSDAAELILFSQAFCPVAKLNFLSVIDSDFFILEGKKRNLRSLNDSS